VSDEELIARAHEMAADLTRRLIPRELRERGLRFVFDDSALSVLSEKGTDHDLPTAAG
jgi:hypothetical protein